ncbi:MAG: GNAT family N-acetyltransferase [Candidatus Sumerlaeaceae bacterium]
MQNPLPRVTVRALSQQDRLPLLAANRRSREMHRRWVNPPINDEQFDAYMLKCSRDDCHGFVICDVQTQQIAAAANVSNVVLGAMHGAFLGYYGIANFAGRGYMTAGLIHVISWAFGDLRLHRLEANVQPDNLASKKLLARLGFRLEGFSPRYLKIAGRWRDHERYAILAEEWQQRPRHLR